MSVVQLFIDARKMARVDISIHADLRLALPYIRITYERFQTVLSTAYVSEFRSGRIFHPLIRFSPLPLRVQLYPPDPVLPSILNCGNRPYDDFSRVQKRSWREMNVLLSFVANAALFRRTRMQAVYTYH